MNAICHCSGPNDHVFVNFVDHGSPFMVSFPVGFVSINSIYFSSTFGIVYNIVLQYETMKKMSLNY